MYSLWDPFTMQDRINETVSHIEQLKLLYPTVRSIKERKEIIKEMRDDSLYLTDLIMISESM